jgi:hypothetical protein
LLILFSLFSGGGYKWCATDVCRYHHFLRYYNVSGSLLHLTFKKRQIYGVVPGEDRLTHNQQRHTHCDVAHQREKERTIYNQTERRWAVKRKRAKHATHTKTEKMGEYKHTHTHKHTRGNLKKKENLITILGDDDDLIIFPLRTQSHGELSILVSLDAIPFLLPTLCFK